MLRGLGITNFKCFAELDLRCAPLNLLCGLNGMGKSSVIQALLVLRQSFQSGHLQKGRLVLGGGLVDLGAGADVLFEDAPEEEIGFRLGFVEPTVSWQRSFRYSRTGDQLAPVEAAEGAGEGVPEVLAVFPPYGGRLAHVPAERVGPQKFYPLSKIAAERGEFGERGELAWNLLSERQDEQLLVDDPRRGGAPGRRLADILDHWLQDVSPGAHLGLRSLTDADAVIAGFSFDRPGDVPTRRFRATNVGFGLSYAVPVVLALLSPAGTLCLIENPEAHLHPRGQTKLAELAARAALAGVQVFAETHSDHFLDGVRIAVRNGLITPAEIAVHYFERDGGRTMVSSPEIDPDGRLSHWPNGFFDQHEENLARLLAPRT